jgi:hypothetical protein
MGFRKKFVSIVGAMFVVGAAFAAGAAAVAPSASAGEVRPMGWVSVHHCASVVGTAKRDETVALSATIAGCGNGNTTTTPGTGSLVATLSTTSQDGFVSLNGTFTITWPADERLSPSSGTLSVVGPDDQGVYTVGGSIAAGAFTGALVRTSIAFDKAGGAFTNSVPLTVQRNNW